MRRAGDFQGGFCGLCDKDRQRDCGNEGGGALHPTPFEIETAAAFLYFAQENCDLVLFGSRAWR